MASVFFCVPPWTQTFWLNVPQGQKNTSERHMRYRRCVTAVVPHPHARFIYPVASTFHSKSFIQAVCLRHRRMIFILIFSIVFKISKPEGETVVFVNLLKVMLSFAPSQFSLCPSQGTFAANIIAWTFLCRHGKRAGGTKPSQRPDQLWQKQNPVPTKWGGWRRSRLSECF